jgi:ribosomal protein L37AE/L43A
MTPAHKPDPVWLVSYARYQCAECGGRLKYREGTGVWVHVDDNQITGL